MMMKTIVTDDDETLWPVWAAFTLSEMGKKKEFEIKEVIFNNPATIVYWKDGTKTVVTCMDQVVNGKPEKCGTYSKETGLSLCFMKKAHGNKGNYNDVFREWIKD